MRYPVLPHHVCVAVPHELIRDAVSHRVRLGAVRVLGALTAGAAGQSSAALPLLQLLAGRLEDRATPVRAAAVAAIQQLVADPAVGAGPPALDDGAEAARFAVVRAAVEPVLLRMDLPSAPSAPDLFHVAAPPPDDHRLAWAGPGDGTAEETFDLHDGEDVDEGGGSESEERDDTVKVGVSSRLAALAAVGGLQTAAWWWHQTAVEAEVVLSRCCRCCSDPDPTVRLAAVELLGHRSSGSSGGGVLAVVGVVAHEDEDKWQQWQPVAKRGLDALGCANTLSPVCRASCRLTRLFFAGNAARPTRAQTSGLRRRAHSLPCCNTVFLRTGRGWRRWPGTRYIR